MTKKKKNKLKYAYNNHDSHGVKMNKVRSSILKFYPLNKYYYLKTNGKKLTMISSF